MPDTGLQIASSAILGITGLTVAVIAVLIARHDRASRNVPFILLLACVAVYATFYSIEIASPTLEAKLLLVKFEYLGIAFIPFFWILTALRFANRDYWLSIPVYLFLALIPLTTITLYITFEHHEFYYTGWHLDTAGPFPMFVAEHGPWFWVQMAWQNLMLLGGNLLFSAAWRNASAPNRRRAGIMLLASAIPWAAHLAYLFGFRPHQIELSSLAMAISCIVFSRGVFRYGLVDLAPVARSLVFNQIDDAVLVLDRASHVSDCNQVFRQLFPEIAALHDESPLKRIRVTSEPLAGLVRHAQGDPPHGEYIDVQIGETVLRCRFMRLSNSRGKLIGRALVFTDISDHVAMRNDLRRLASTDLLTGVGNRRFFLALADREIGRRLRRPTPISLAIIDLDFFKGFNDDFGHQAGDEVLRMVATTCQHCLRQTDIFGRYGGEEFAVCMPETDAASAMQVAERLRRSIANLVFEHGTASRAITISVGVANSRAEDEISLDDLLGRADSALYRAKANGRNCVVLASPETREVTA